MFSPGVVFKLPNAQLYLDVTATKMFTDSTCQGWGTFLGVGQDFRSLNSDVRFPVLGFGTNTGEGRSQGMPASRVQHYWAKPIWYRGDRLRYPSADFSTFDVLNVGKYKDGLFWRNFGWDVQLKLQSGRSALSNIDILFWEIPGSKKFRHF